VLPIALGTLFFRLLPKRFWKFFYIPFIGAVLLLFRYLWAKGMYNFTYTTQMSMLQWAFCILTVFLIMGMVLLFQKDVTPSLKLMILLAMLVVVITPLGTNNHLIASINNLFFVAPLLLWLVIRWLQKHPPFHARYSMFPIKATCIGVFAMIFFQSGLFGWFYVFQEANGGENLHTAVEKNDILRGMLTSSDRAEVIGSVSEYVTQANLHGKSIILYGMIPAMSYYLEMPFALSPWPDLASYGYEVMAKDLAALEETHRSGEGGDYPLILLEASYGAFEGGGESALALRGIDAAKYTNDRKFALLQMWMDTHSYEIWFENEKFVLYGSTRN
jgi:hypothetical protein